MHTVAHASREMLVNVPIDGALELLRLSCLMASSWLHRFDRMSHTLNSSSSHSLNQSYRESCATDKALPCSSTN